MRWEVGTDIHTTVCKTVSQDPRYSTGCVCVCVCVCVCWLISSV